jgi:iron-sulfur cluster assembly accessory protein
MNTDAVVTLTENAANEIRAKLAADAEGAAKGLRLYVEKGGCSGLQYGMTFDQKRPDDLEASHFGVSVLVDPFSADYLARHSGGLFRRLDRRRLQNHQPQSRAKLRLRQILRTRPAGVIIRRRRWCLRGAHLTF